MASADFGYYEKTDTFTTQSTTYVDVTGASLAADFAGATDSSGVGFIEGKKYLLMVTASYSTNTATARSGVQVLHGTTAFSDSESVGNSDTADHMNNYRWFTVWTAVADEAIKLQAKTLNAAWIGRVANVTILAIRLSDHFTESQDWYYDEEAADANPLNATDGASITWTPAAVTDWLMMTQHQGDFSINSTRATSALVLDDVAILTSGWETSQATATLSQIHNTYAAELTAASHTLKERGSSDTGTAHTRLYSKVFAIRLNVFMQYAYQWTAGTTALSATNYATAAGTASLTPDLTGPVWVMGSLVFDKANVGRSGEFRLQVANSDAPAGQTAANYTFRAGADSLDDEPIYLQAVLDMTEDTPTAVDLDASADSITSTPGVLARLVLAITLQLLAVAGGSQYYYNG